MYGIKVTKLIGRKAIFAEKHKNGTRENPKGGGCNTPSITFFSSCERGLDFYMMYYIIIFGTYNKLPLYFQLSETTCCLIGFHANKIYINDVTSGGNLSFSNF